MSIFVSTENTVTMVKLRKVLMPTAVADETPLQAKNLAPPRWRA